MAPNSDGDKESIAFWHKWNPQATHERVFPLKLGYGNVHVKKNVQGIFSIDKSKYSIRFNFFLKDCKSVSTIFSLNFPRALGSQRTFCNLLTRIGMYPFMVFVLYHSQRESCSLASPDGFSNSALWAARVNASGTPGMWMK